jgi:hypothetical protein
MDLQVKSFRLESAGCYLLIIARGLMNIAGLKTVFYEIAQSTRLFLHCKVLVDLIDTTLRLDPTEIDAFFNGLQGEPWRNANRVALIVAPQLAELPTLVQLRDHIVRRGLSFVVFADTKAAVEWLAL